MVILTAPNTTLRNRTDFTSHYTRITCVRVCFNRFHRHNADNEQKKKKKEEENTRSYLKKTITSLTFADAGSRLAIKQRGTKPMPTSNLIVTQASMWNIYYLMWIQCAAAQSNPFNSCKKNYQQPLAARHMYMLYYYVKTPKLHMMGRKKTKDSTCFASNTNRIW